MNSTLSVGEAAGDTEAAGDGEAVGDGVGVVAVVVDPAAVPGEAVGEAAT
ncbi:MAG TPA: hypothetical protein VM656_01215 [Pyrinomonadaceae bacterium]|nr:hypothetical protein [Pyrinomonadaceae bacterium]